MSNNQSDRTVSSTADGGAAVNPVVWIKKARKGLPDFLQSVNLKHVKLGYHYLMSHLLTLCLVPLIGITLVQASQMNYQDFQNLYLHLQLNLISIVVVSAFIVFGSTVYVMSRPRSIYLVDYACYRPPDHLKVKYKKFMDHSRLTGDFDDSSLEFQRKILERSGLGEETYLPEAMHCIPPQPSMATAREEAEQVMFGALDNLFKSTKVKPKDIGILVVNCSLFNPTPSLSAMIVNKYKLRGNIKSFNLGGMGCSAGVIAIDLAKDMLQVHRNTYAVVVSTENITQNWYFGNKKSMLIPNCLFRVGCAATLLSNKASEKRRAKYKLVHVVRTHKGAEDTAFKCVYQEQDENGKTGVSLSKDLMAIAGGALKTNITTLGPLVLPISEQLLFFLTLVARKLCNNAKIKPYIPDFKLAFDHFCIHAGGRGVIDELEKNLQLSAIHVEASRMTLHRFGNTSSSSIWYELAYTEAKGSKLSGHKSEVCGLKWSYDNRELASGGNDNRLFVWNQHSTQPVLKYSEHTAAVKAIAWSPHMHGLLASGGGTADRCIHFWNTTTNSHLSCMDTGSQVCNLVWSKNVNELVSTHGYSQNQIIVWRYPTMSKLATLTGHTYRVLYLAISPDGQTIVTGAGDETLRFWNVFPSPKSQNTENEIGASSLGRTQIR